MSRYCSEYYRYVIYFPQQFYEVNTINNFPFVVEDTDTNRLSGKHSISQHVVGGA